MAQDIAETKTQGTCSTENGGACPMPDPEEKTRLRRTIQWTMLALVPIVIIGGLFWPYLGFIVPVVMITHRTTEAAIRRAFDAIEGDRHIDRPPKMIRIEGM